MWAEHFDKLLSTFLGGRTHPEVREFHANRRKYTDAAIKQESPEMLSPMKTPGSSAFALTSIHPFLMSLLTLPIIPFVVLSIRGHPFPILLARYRRTVLSAPFIIANFSISVAWAWYQRTSNTDKIIKLYKQADLSTIEHEPKQASNTSKAALSQIPQKLKPNDQKQFINLNSQVEKNLLPNADAALRKTCELAAQRRVKFLTEFIGK